MQNRSGSGDVLSNPEFNQQQTKVRGVMPSIASETEEVYFGVLNGHIYELGRLKVDRSTGLFMKKIKSVRELNTLIAKLRSLKNVASANLDSDVKLEFDKAFKPIIVSDISEQSLLIETLRALTSFDQKERGCFIRLTEENSSFRLYVEQVFNVGKEHEVNFRFPLDARGSLSTTDKNGDLLIATVHSHNHDNGLSGLSREEIADGKGDISNIKFTGIPWIVIGSTKVEAGYSTDYGDILTEEIASDNLALYALWRIAVR